MRKHHWEGKVLTGFACCITVNRTLVTGSNRTIRVSNTISHFKCNIYTRRNISTLLMYEHKYCELPRIISDLSKYIFYDETDIHFTAAGDFARHDNFSFSSHDLTGHTRSFIFTHTSIQNIISNEVTKLIWMSHADTFSCFISNHIFLLSYLPRLAVSRRSITSSCGLAPLYSPVQFSLTIWNISIHRRLV